MSDDEPNPKSIAQAAAMPAMNSSIIVRFITDLSDRMAFEDGDALPVPPFGCEIWIEDGVIKAEISGVSDYVLLPVGQRLRITMESVQPRQTPVRIVVSRLFREPPHDILEWSEE